MSVWLLGSVATDMVGNATALDLAEGEISWPYIYRYMLYSHRRWIREQICENKKRKEEKSVPRL